MGGCRRRDSGRRGSGRFHCLSVRLRLFSRRLQLGDVHQVLDALAELRRHELHALAELAGQQVGLALGRLAKRAYVGGVRVDGDGGQRDDRQREEGENESRAKAHENSATTGP